MAIASHADMPLGAVQEEPESTAPEAKSGSAQEHLAWLVQQTQGKSRDDRSALLMMRFALLNLFGGALVGLAWHHGLIAMALAADSTGLSYIIGAVFLAGLALCGFRCWQTGIELDRLRHLDRMQDFEALTPSKATEYVSLLRGVEGEGRSLIASSFRLKLTQRIASVKHIANSLVVLGLIGTVIGFVIALSGIDPNSASDVKAIAPMVSTMIEGMSTALYTTLIGAILNLWLLTNYQLLATGTVKLITGLVEFGETHGRS